MNAHGEVCMSGAIQMATEKSLKLQEQALELMHATLGGPLISTWNDACERTKDQVIAKLKEAAYAQRS